MPFETTRITPNWHNGQTYIESRALEALQAFELRERMARETQETLAEAQLAMAQALKDREAAKEALIAALTEHYAPKPMPAAMHTMNFILLFSTDDFGRSDIECFDSVSYANLYKIEDPQSVAEAA